MTAGTMSALSGLLWVGLVVAVAYAGRWLFRELTKWRPRAVYFIEDQDGQILYIGSCYAIRTRMLAHRRKSAWYPQASHHFQATLEPDRVIWYRNPGLANAAEIKAIREAQPPGNTVGTVHGRRRMVIEDE
jgi:predicted GIY-YIG superfamily endonuclease